MTTQRLTFIDIARSISIILIVIYHYEPENSPDWYSSLNNIGISFRIPLLMFVSGYIYTMVKKPVKYRDFVLNKFKRLTVPYLFISTMVICIKLLVEKDMFKDPVSISSFYEMFYLPSAGFFVWFIYTLFLVFLIIPFADTPRKLNIFLILSLILLLIPIDFPMLFCLFYLKKNLFYFVLGCFICAKANLKLIIDKIPAIALFVFFTLVYGLKLITHASWLTPLIDLSLAVSGIFFILNISMQIDRETNPIKPFFIKLSSYTYTIYLFHTTAEGFAKMISLKIPLENYLTPDFCFVFKAFFVITLGILVPVVIHKIVVSKSRLFSFLIGAKYLPKIALSK
ncbi:MAG: acyltransferase [Dysgonamonadaceae bacterium]|jgi:fucose 4-O-acetylase-like acetyltransferase|nr:acyltransferase [Dysgonamonadaceae bacterium]